MGTCCQSHYHGYDIMTQKSYRNKSLTYRRPRRPFEKERLETELKLVGEYGLRNKREILRVQKVLAGLRKSARHLLTLDEKDNQRLFEGGAILRRCMRMGLLTEDSCTLDNVLSLKIADFMERRLQTKVFKMGLARSIHHARVLIHGPHRQREAHRLRHHLSFGRREARPRQ